MVNWTNRAKQFRFFGKSNIEKKNSVYDTLPRVVTDQDKDVEKELQKMLDSVHDGITTFDFEGKETPCIIIEEEKYGLIRAKIEGQHFSVNTDLNILQDGLGNVFVEIILTFSVGNISEKFLVNAKTDLKFFEILANTSMFVVNSPESRYGQDNIIAIQLPRPEKAHDALKIIKNALISKNQ